MMNNNGEHAIRLANTGDIDFIAGSQVNMAWETEQLNLDPDIVYQGVKAVFNDSSKGFYIISETGNSKSGCLLITPEWSDWRNAWIWWIQSVYVQPAHRRSGVFGTMYGYIRELVLRRSDVSGIRLYVDNTNISACGVYTRMGMNGEHYRTFEWIKL